MKSKIALLLSFVLIFTLALPAQGFAAEMSKDLENAIKTVRVKFSIPDDYEFSSNISTSGGRKVFYLNYSSRDTVNPTYINAAVDENGMIINYNKYSSYDYKRDKRLPNLSKQEAKAKADAYINMIEEGLAQKLQYQEIYQDSILSNSYFFSYYRVVNGIPFYKDNVYVTVNSDTGELLDYSRGWTGKIDFPSTADTISLKEAQAAYAKNLGLRLIYRSSINDDFISAYPVYAPVYSNEAYAVDALTGERVRLNSIGVYFNDYGAGMGQSAIMDKGELQSAAGEIQLSPEELEAVQETAKLISQEKAEQTARTAEFLGISDSYKLESYYLGANWPEKKEYSWTLQFYKQTDGSNVYEDYASVTINAKTGEITGFYRNKPTADGTKPKHDIATAKAAADAFLKKYYPEYYKQIEYNELADEYRIYPEGANPDRYNFIYERVVNGVPFPDNGVNITYDNKNGIISGFSLSWYNISYPALDNVIGLEAAYESLFEKVGLGLEYKLQYQENVDIYAPDSAEKAKVLPVYALKPNKPQYISAFTGAILNYNGTEYKERERIEYTDIKGHFAEKQIMVLADNGIYLEGKEFKPDTEIIQLDFMALLSKTLNYYGPSITIESRAKEIDDMYAYLQREGIIREGERQPDKKVTREEAVKYLIRALKYDKVADISDIFNLQFKDKDAISPGLTGYVAIAAGLGIVKGDGVNFNPLRNVTRGESAVMIYNYLQRG